MTSKIEKTETNFCQFHNLKREYICSCTDHICIECITLHKDHPDFFIRKEGNSYKSLVKYCKDLQNSVKFLDSSYSSEYLNENLSVINTEFLSDYIFNALAINKNFTDTIKEIIEIINNNIDHLNENEKNKLMSANYLEILQHLVIIKSKALNSLEHSISENIDSFNKEYKLLLEKHFLSNIKNKPENNNEEGNILDCVEKGLGKIDLSNLNNEKENMYRSISDKIPNYSSVMDKNNYLESEETLINVKQPLNLNITDRQSRETSKNVKQPLKLNIIGNTKQMNCLDCKVGYEVNISESYMIRCKSCYYKLKNKNK